VHAFPLLPQFVTDGVSHVLPLQQPEVHVSKQAWHVWLTHALVPHEMHALPPPPHWVLFVPGWHTPFASQHPRQLVPLHMHWPPTHAWPPAHAARPPQVH
jgi:hypothetical protein